MDGGGPIFYGHRRVGYRGRHFRCWKFRTMVVNGDAVLQKYLADNPEERSIWFTQRKLRNDPRVTPLGRVLRKLSLDELPQIINVLIGEMSFVGPRPIVDAELAMYRSSAGHYLRNRPGITGLWQVSGRSDTSFTRRIALDRLYSQRWTVLADLRVLVWTIPAVVFAKGAH
jgi:exopolysaccharide production protein ExoY